MYAQVVKASVHPCRTSIKPWVMNMGYIFVSFCQIFRGAASC